jgi:hypothetical protein
LAYAHGYAHAPAHIPAVAATYKVID